MEALTARVSALETAVAVLTAAPPRRRPPVAPATEPASAAWVSVAQLSSTRPPSSARPATSYSGTRRSYRQRCPEGDGRDRLTFTIHGPDGDTILAVAANGQRFRRNVRIDYFTIVGNGATLLVDISGPQEYEEPNYLTATVSGTVTVTDTAVEANTAMIANAFALLPGGQIQKATNGGILTGTE